MQRACKNFLAPPALPKKQHGGICIGDTAQHVAYGIEAGRHPHDVALAEHGLGLASHCRALG